MRCTRCDRPAAPQTVGWTPAGQLVFGWCPACMDDRGCRLIEAPPFGRDIPIAVVIQMPVAPMPPPAPNWTKAAPDPAATRARLPWLRRLAIACEGWAAVLVVAGFFLQVWPRSGVPISPFGNGTPALLLVGGLGMAATGVVFWALSLAPRSVVAQPPLPKRSDPATRPRIDRLNRRS
jgi:hypothetical protein